MKDAQPSMEDWASLYDAAMKFKKLAPWNWMMDSHVFGVQNPFNDEIGYCCIMGNLGQFYAMAAYTGTEGLEKYLMIQDGTFEPGSLEALMAQKCLMASFEDRNELTDKDRNIIKKLELKYRGNNEWPLFRKYEPGYHPGYLTGNEAQYLTMALQQAIEISTIFKEDPDKIISDKDRRFFVRIPKKTQSGFEWKDKWMLPEPLKEDKMEDIVPALKEDFLQEFKTSVQRSNSIWEVDVFPIMMPLRGNRGDRLYYPFMILMVDSRSGLSFSFGLSDYWDYRKEFTDKLLNSIINMGIPSEIKVRSRDVYELLAIIAKQLGIKLTSAKKLPVLEKFEKTALGRFGL